MLGSSISWERQVRSMCRGSSQKLDEIANETFVTAFHQSELVCALASEGDGKAGPASGELAAGQAHVALRPLDGSSNTDCNMPLGTIFPS